MNWFEYWIGHCWMTGWQSIRSSLKIWGDLMTNNYENYALLKEDDPFEHCYEWFWWSLGEDDTYPKEFLEHLQQMAQDVIDGKIETYPIEDLDKFFQELKEDFEDE